MTINALGIIPTKSSSCSVMGDYAIKKKMTVPYSKAKKGDIVNYDFNHNGTSDHTGIVYKIESGKLYVVEGNTSKDNDCNGGAVCKRIRFKGNVNYLIRPKYDSKVTADMVIATAMAEVGIKEAPKDSNNVKYNTWFYGKEVAGKAYPWCEVFVCWCFANTLEKVPKPKGEYSGTIPQPTISFGDKGAKVTQLQQFLTWYGIKTNADGKFGRKTLTSVLVFQITEGLTPDGVFGKKSYSAAGKYIKKATPAPVPTPVPDSVPAPKPTPVATGYTGTFPELNNNIKIVNSLAHKYCYPYGTAQKKYKFSTGKPKPEYAKGIDEAYPNHKSWPNARQRAGACCDILVGSVLAHVGIKVKKDLKDQLKEMPKMTSQLKSNGHCKASEFKLGDVVQRGRKDYSGHTWIVCELVNGKKYIANSHYKKLKGCYAVMDAKPATIVPSKWKYYKCYTVQGAVRTHYEKGDYGYDVLYVQRFLNWYGIKCTADGDFGDKTEAAVKTFQKAMGLTIDGKVGAKTIAAMKAVKK